MLELDHALTGRRFGGGRPAVFSRALACIDGSEEAVGALRQAQRLRPDGEELLAVAVCETHYGVHEPLPDVPLRPAGECAAAAATSAAEALVPGLSTRILEGRVIASLLGLLEEDDATLVAVGTHGRSGAYGIPLGGVATAVLRNAPCSVLVARRPAKAPASRFPRSVVVGVDGSAESLRAAAVAEDLAGRLGCDVRLVAATGGKSLEVGGLAASGLDVEWDERAPVDALVAAAQEADLVLVGNRGLHEGDALGSVSRRVAERASCSVLVVRDDDLRFAEDAQH